MHLSCILQGQLCPYHIYFDLYLLCTWHPLSIQNSGVSFSVSYTTRIRFTSTHKNEKSFLVYISGRSSPSKIDRRKERGAEQPVQNATVWVNRGGENIRSFVSA